MLDAFLADALRYLCETEGIDVIVALRHMEHRVSTSRRWAEEAQSEADSFRDRLEELFGTMGNPA
jgi:hypothetical protein